jgi:hypothetical protein
VNQELLGTVAKLRTTIERQQAYIDRLVQMTFGRKSERVTGPTLFDGLPNPIYHLRPMHAPQRTRPNPQPRSDAVTGADRAPPTCHASGSRST